MRRSLASALALVACGPAHVFHKDPERGCAEITLAGPEDVAAAAGCRTVDSITLRTGMALDLKPLGRLETIRGALSIGPSVGMSEVSLPRLREAGAIRIVANGDLHGLYLPALEHAAAFEIDGNHQLSTIVAPKLAVVSGAFAITGNAVLEVLNVAALASAGQVTLTNNPKLTLIDSKLSLTPPVPAVESAPMPE